MFKSKLRGFDLGMGGDLATAVEQSTLHLNVRKIIVSNQSLSF